MIDTFYVLGAMDPEMREIRKQLDELNIPYGFAAKSGLRCNSRSAYSADGVVALARSGAITPLVLEPFRPVVLVECFLASNPVSFRLDHHNPGDAGYLSGPAEYLKGSSLGQLLERHSLSPTEDQRLIAAGDHCLSAAYQGACPGVDPGDLLFSRAAWKAKMAGVGLGEMVGAILEAAAFARSSYDPELGYADVRDPTVAPAELPEGAALAGIAVRYRNEQGKVMLKGGTPDQIEAFMAEYRESAAIYGNPHRGYAGAYLA